jgi:membrane protein implicated in regulation of membrane protease activity
MNLNKKQLIKILLAIVISAALTLLSVFVAVNLGQAALQWFDSLEPRTRTYFTLGMLVIALVPTVFVIWRMRKARKQ